MNLLRTLIRRFDAWLSRVEGVESFTDDPRCILRLQSTRAAHEILLQHGTIPVGARVLMIHAYNEHIPRMPPAGADLAYASQLYRLQIHSLQAVARHILAPSSLDDVQAVGGVTAHISLKEVDGGRAMLERLGFTVFPYHRPAGAFGEFWENFYTWWLLWTFNPPTVRHRSLWNLQRTEFWMTRSDFLKRYGLIGQV